MKKLKKYLKNQKNNLKTNQKGLSSPFLIKRNICVDVLIAFKPCERVK